MSEQVTTHALLGRILDRKYELVRLIGEGGMGTVFEGKHILLHHSVAVKILHRNYAKMPTLVERFVREAQAASAIGHPNITKAIDFGKEKDGLVYIVMEMLHGENLLELISRKGRIPHPHAVTIVLQVLSALNAAHEKGIIHRDLKPDNVFLAEDPRGKQEVKLLDFGVVKFVDDDTKSDFGLTQPGTVIGTPNYLSPEQARGRKDIDTRIDIWSAGVILYETLSGQLPFIGDTYNEIMGKILLDPPPPLQALVPELPEQLVAVVSKAMRKDRNHRFQTVGEFISALMPLHEQKDRKLMSTGVLAALKVPTPRPDPPHPSGEDDTEEKQGISTPVQWNPDGIVVPKTPLKNNLSPVALGTTHSNTKRLMIISIAVALFIVSSALVYHTDVLPSAMEKIRLIAPWLMATSASENSAPQEIAKEEDPLRTNEKIQNPGESIVKIQLLDLPPNARVKFDNRWVTIPIKIPQSKRPLPIRIVAQGYETYTGVIVPSMSKKIRINMTKSIGGQKATHPETKRGKVWTTNPFKD